MKTLTREEFIARFRGQMMHFLGESWAIRKATPSNVGEMMDAHVIIMNRLMNEMFDALSPTCNPLEKTNAATTNAQPGTPAGRAAPATGGAPGGGRPVQPGNGQGNPAPIPPAAQTGRANAAGPKADNGVSF